MSEDIQLGFDFDRQFDQFDVKGLKTEFNEKGGIESGYQYRWVRNDDLNTDRKKLREGYALDLDPDTVAPYGDNDTGLGKHIKAYNEDYALYKRPVETMRAEREWMEKRRAGALEKANKYSGPEAKSDFMLKFNSEKSSKRPVKKGR